jgi:solute carrier family 25 folate transporter 32
MPAIASAGGGGGNAAGLSPAVIESIAGLSAGTVSTLVVHPLDIVKTRMQSEKPSF